MTQTFIILTVGTGTAGAHSNLVQGIVNTLKKSAPCCYWLVPSQSNDSIATADLIREGVVASCKFMPWSGESPYSLVKRPDDLFECRNTLRAVIATAKGVMGIDDRLIVNPTSGTKQMSAGATLAALDEEIGEIFFTIGERVDGVVKTGTEQLAAFSTATFFFERDLRMAESFFRSGSFLAAQQILKRHMDHQKAVRAQGIALCLYEWQRLNYQKAARHAAVFSETVHSHLLRLANSKKFSLPVLGDLLAGGDELVKWGDAEEALARFYNSTELAAKARLALSHGIWPPYSVEKIVNSLPKGSEVRNELDLSQSRDLNLGAMRAFQILNALDDAFGKAFFRDQDFIRRLQARNESIYGHGRAPVDEQTAQLVRNRLRRLFQNEWHELLPHWTVDLRPKSLML